MVDFSRWNGRERNSYLDYLKTHRKRIIELSNVQIYKIIRKLINKLPVTDVMCVTGLVGISTRFVGNPDAFNRQLQHVFNSLEFNEKDSAILHKHLAKAEIERLKREKEEKEFEENARKKGIKLLPRIGIN